MSNVYIDICNNMFFSFLLTTVDGKNIIKDVDDVDDDDDDDDEYEYVPPEVGHTWKSFADDDKAPDEPPQYLDMLGDNTKGE